LQYFGNMKNKPVEVHILRPALPKQDSSNRTGRIGQRKRDNRTGQGRLERQNPTGRIRPITEQGKQIWHNRTSRTRIGRTKIGRTRIGRTRIGRTRIGRTGRAGQAEQEVQAE
jgi:hypothetical protein